MLVMEAKAMDQMKTGQFIAQLRRENGLTQERLGDMLGVTNKTISRWENGHYAPDIDMLQALSLHLDVSINELICGERLDDAHFRTAADANLAAAWADSCFTLNDRLSYWKHKWREEHKLLVVSCTVFITVLFIFAVATERTYLVGMCPLLMLAAYAWLNNRMMAYAEGHVFRAVGTAAEPIAKS